MSTWHARAVERLGTPLPSWPSIYGPTSGPEPIVDNDLAFIDLTPYLVPLEEIAQEMERDFLRSPIGSITLTLVDGDGALAEALGPRGTLATATRYASPWVQITEHWMVGDIAHDETRFVGYVDEASISWDEMAAETTMDVLHASNLLKERVLSNYEELLRPWPRYPEEPSDFHAVLGDDLLDAVATPPSTLTHAQRLVREQALWATGRFSFFPGMVYWNSPEPVEGGVGVNWTYNCPPPPAPTCIIDGEPYAVENLGWDTYPGDLFREVGGTTGYAVAVVRLSGAPDLSAVLYEGATIEWPLTEAALSYYEMAGGIPAPPDGEEGQRYVQLVSVEHLVAGDELGILYREGATRKTKKIPLIDIDGTTNRVYGADPISEAIPGMGGEVIRIRRDSRDPVLVDGLAYAARAVAPFALDVSQLLPAATAWPVLSWMPLDAATPEFYGIIDLQHRAGEVQISRRGADGTASALSVWRGPVVGPWAWSFETTEVLQQYGQDFQFPGGAANTNPMPMYLEGDTTDTVPTNGWRRVSRSLPRLWQDDMTVWHMKDTETSSWTGSTFTWAVEHAPAVPFLLAAYSAHTTCGQGVWRRTSAGAWTWEAYGTSPGSITPSGTLPTGDWWALGMGAYDTHATGHVEAVLGLVVTGTPSIAGTYTSAVACLLLPGYSGALSVAATETLTTGTPSVWTVAGGLVIAVFPELLAGQWYQHTRLWRVDGSLAVNDLPTLEVLPGTVQPLSLDEDGLISGWMMLALESYSDDNGEMRRRSRLVKIGQDLEVINGDPVPNPSDPLNPSVAWKLGALIADPVIEGVLGARMIRTGVDDEMVGFIGGRLFTIAPRINTTLERIRIKDLDAMSFLEVLGQGLLATACARPDGSLALVSRVAGPLRAEVDPDYVADLLRRPVGTWAGTVRTTYEDPISGSQTLTTYGPRAGGRPLDQDLSVVISGASQAYGIGTATAAFWADPPRSISCTWVDLAAGVQGSLPPVWWAAYGTGDRIPFDGRVWKLTTLTSHPEDRTAAVELQEIP